MKDVEPIYCELCRLPHEPGTVRCDECGHQLGTPPDWEALEREIPGLRAKIALTLLSVAVMIGVNLALFGGAGYFVLLAPIIWLAQNGYRYAIVRKRLAARAAVTRTE